jgi:hypothetical protein
MKEGPLMNRNRAPGTRFALWLAALILALVPATRAQQDTRAQDPSSAGSSSADAGSNTFPNKPVVTSMETGQPLGDQSGGGPLPAGRSGGLLRIGHLSLLSLSSFYYYDSNFEFKPQPEGANAVAFEGLLLYSIGNDRTALDLQYRPYILVAQGSAQTNLVGSAFNLHTHHYFTPVWLLDLENRFQYAPAQGRLIDPTIGPDLSATGGIARNPFLFNGQTTLTNAVVAKISHSTEHDILSFQGQYQYLSAWKDSNSQDSSSTHATTSTPSTSLQDNTGGVTISWTHNISTQHSFGASYVYNRALGSNNVDQFQYHSLFFEYSQLLRPSLQMVVSFGPSWQLPKNGKTGKHYVASALLVKRFSASELVFSYATNYGYIGIISNGYYERYDGYYSLHLTPRWDISAGMGYAKQDIHQQQSFDGREEWVRGTYLVTERLSAFVAFSNYAGQGGPYPYASRNLFIVGARWAYEREHAVQP